MLDVHLGYMYARGRTRRRMTAGREAPRRRLGARALRVLAGRDRA